MVEVAVSCSSIARTSNGLDFMSPVNEQIPRDFPCDFCSVTEQKSHKPYCLFQRMKLKKASQSFVMPDVMPKTLGQNYRAGLNAVISIESSLIRL